MDAIQAEEGQGPGPLVLTLHPDVERDGMPDLREHLHDALSAGTRHIVVDASCIDELPSLVIGALLTAHQACRGRGGSVEIRYPSRRALDQIHRTGLQHVFHISPAATPSSKTPPRRRGRIRSWL